MDISRLQLHWLPLPAFFFIPGSGLRKSDFLKQYFRSLQHIYAQIIDDVSGKTLVSASTVEKDFEDYGGNKSAARKVGITLAKRAAEKGITGVVFDRGGYVYHGRVQELAEGAREGGLNF